MCPVAPDLASLRGELRRRHVCRGPRPRLLAEVSNDATTCPMAPPPWEGSSGAATCPTAPGSTFLREELRCCHVSHSHQWAVDHRNKERLSCQRYAVRLTCFQGTLVRYWDGCKCACHYSVSPQCSVGPTGHFWTWLQWWYIPTGRHHGTCHVQCSRAIRRNDSTLLTPCNTSFATPSHYDTNYCIGFQPPRGHLSGPGSHCNDLTLSYKRLGQAPLLRGGRKRQAQKGQTWAIQFQFSHGRRVLRSGGLNHVNLHVHRVHPQLATKGPKPPSIKAIKELQWAAPLAAPMEVS
jgi:hypothetical protein